MHPQNTPQSNAVSWYFKYVLLAHISNTSVVMLQFVLLFQIHIFLKGNLFKEEGKIRFLWKNFKFLENG